MVTIDLKKRDLWILTALIFFLIGVGLVVGFGDYRTGNPRVMGHSSDEVMVLNKAQAEVTLQNYIDNSGSNVEVAQAFRKDDNNNRAGTIVTVSGNSNAFIPIDNANPHAQSAYKNVNNLDGIKCANGWRITGCWIAAKSGGEDVFSYDNGCITKKYDTETDTEMSVVCIKVS